MHLCKFRLPATWMVFTALGFLMLGDVSGQKVDVPADSLKKMLCKKWEVNYVLADGVKIVKSPGAPARIFDFKPDNSFVFIQEEGAASFYGKWIYNPKRKWVQLVIDGKTNGLIISVLPEEMIMVDEKKKNAPSINMEMVYKVKRD
ncbi:MAG: hypothetical protein ABIY90_09180 [Puia sp.]